MRKRQRELAMLDARLRGVEKTVERLTDEYRYRVTKEGDVWRAATVTYQPFSLDLLAPPRGYHDDGTAEAYGITRPSAEKALKAKLLKGTTPTFTDVDE